MQITPAADESTGTAALKAAAAAGFEPVNQTADRNRGFVTILEHRDGRGLVIVLDEPHGELKSARGRHNAAWGTSALHASTVEGLRRMLALRIARCTTKTVFLTMRSPGRMTGALLATPEALSFGFSVPGMITVHDTVQFEANACPMRSIREVLGAFRQEWPDLTFSTLEVNGSPVPTGSLAQC